MSSPPPKTTIRYFLASSFTNDPFTGNPSATLLVEKPTLPRSTLLKIAQNFNQPILSVLYGPKPGTLPSVAYFDVEWYGPFGNEATLSGHGALALARSIFDANLPIVAREVKRLELKTNSMGVVTATRIEGGWIEVVLPAARMEEASEEEVAALNALFDKAVGKTVKIDTIMKGTQGFADYVLIILDDTEDIADWDVDANALLPSAYAAHVVTTSSKGQETYITRTFSPKFCLGGEDHVCGSANSLLAPYWAQQKKIAKGDEMDVWSASKRGGRFKAVWNHDAETVTLRGKASVWAAGKLFI